MGVKTVVSVDGALPRLELASRHGLRYVHIPIGYGGIPDDAGRALARLMREATGLVYIHCHHGRHRGPAAAAVACIAAGAASNQDALEILQRAGTSRDYRGLWRDVEQYRPPAPGADLPKLVEVAPVQSLAAAMAKIDRACENLKLCREAEWGTPENDPDLVPAHQSLLVREGFHEARRNLVEGYDSQFKAWLSSSEKAADRLGQAVLAADWRNADEHFITLMQSCTACHHQYRN
jgi:hypothetical protein